MKDQLSLKLNNQEFSFSNEETHWLLTNIGNENPEIRDYLVFSLFVQGIRTGGFTEEQFRLISETTISKNLIFYQLNNHLPETLTRSFSALLNGLIIEADGKTDSPYYHLLNEKNREYFFEVGIDYFYKETDTCGFSEKYGWVHGFAHGADFLSQIVAHDLFPKERLVEVLEAVQFVMFNLESPFIEGEDRRIAHILYSSLSKVENSQEVIYEWISALDFPLIENKDFYRLAMFENMLAYLYFHSLETDILKKDLKELMLSYLKNY
ncbi:DUF2785 domain-containing protein [Vagococcus carniphilus]|uniref:DUF2785 domain-containing protein n=1 Tax=Vagococcus carniphilus TaxID=218144 RepID=A0AAW8U320_9ENTE|nr:DUF2785 domain-containing protein [Vagococcus carniphilus]MDT2831492.1 DUF2785 domain-containing protein [Vagococcus carniphilus]MDT2832714.1 DUF2785 domain-containing protein [Vagococcus carniphilus]MDT2840214.1 DUF2785 domain-containing protein [Vagococcus carniphilus]MDT2854963.1 DUF2785 domain-containing protein [Vagococcus carniphilus]